jgi:hypothetical protein
MHFGDFRPVDCLFVPYTISWLSLPSIQHYNALITWSCLQDNHVVSSWSCYTCLASLSTSMYSNAISGISLSQFISSCIVLLGDLQSATGRLRRQQKSGWRIRLLQKHQTNLVDPNYSRWLSQVFQDLQNWILVLIGLRRYHHDATICCPESESPFALPIPVYLNSWFQCLALLPVGFQPCLTALNKFIWRFAFFLVVFLAVTLPPHLLRKPPLTFLVPPGIMSSYSRSNPITAANAIVKTNAMI